MKGLSVLVSSVIMIVIVLAVAGVIANWSSLFARERAGGVIGQAEKLLECSSADLFISSVEVDCQDRCGTEQEKLVTVDLRNTGDVSLVIDRFYITNKIGDLFEFRFPVNKTITSGGVLSSFTESNFNCDHIVDNIEVFEVLSRNCPDEGRDSLSGDDVVFINCA